jgi:cadmium resistance protein CadD (predicted permease)
VLSTLGAAVVVFASTNIDDLVVISAFFADPARRPSAVVVGQFVGIGVLTLGSALAALLALVIPAGWVGLLGLGPLALGLRGLFRLGHDRTAAVQPDTPEHGARSPSAPWLAMTLVTVANGGDNLAVYIPLFSRDLSKVPLYAAVFAALTAVWCAVGYGLVHHTGLGHRIRAWGHVVLPFVLIGLGLYVLAATRVLFG